MVNCKNTFHSCVNCDCKEHSIFKSLTKEEAISLDAVKACTVYKKGQIVFTEGGIPQGLYCINSGKVKVFSTGINGKEQILRLLKQGDILGYRSLISNDRYNCSAIAIEDTATCFIPRDNFVEMVKNNPSINYELLQLLSNNLKHAETQIVSMAQKNVRERVAEALLFFRATYGVESDSDFLNITFSREEIADFVGTSTETAIRLLSEFSHDGLIELKGKRIKITNNAKLMRTANLDD